MKWLKIFLIWVSFIPLAILNGGCREYFFVSWLGYPLATALSGVILGFFDSACYCHFIASGKKSIKA